MDVKKTQTRKPNCQYVVGAEGSSGRGKSLDLRKDSSSRHMVEKPSQVCLGGEISGSLKNARLVKRLDQGLKILEEDADILKQAFLECVEERSKLINEIYQQFCDIHQSLCLRGGKSCRILLPKAFKDEGGGAGLLQVLCHESNPFLVIRDQRTNLAQVMCNLANR